MIRTIIIATLFFAYVQARNTTISNCAQDGKILWTNVVPCNSDPCKFTPNTDVSINGQLISNEELSSPIVRAQIKANDAWIDYPGIDNDGCKHTKCPIEANVATSFALSFKTYSWPQDQTQVRFRIFNSDESKELICGETTIEIENDN